MIEVIRDKEKWCEELALADEVDFYHTYDYHHLSKKEDENPILIKYTEGYTSLVLPLLVRSINNSEYKDATSVYGYAGILAISIDVRFKKDVFFNDLNTFFVENKFVTVFSRLHPYLDYQETLLNSFGKISSPGKVVCLDLSETIDNQRAKFSRRLKTYLNKSRKSCVVINGDLEIHLDSFIDLYYENMRRVEADPMYFFNKDYFHQLLSSKDFDSEMLLCVHNETKKVIGGAIFIKKGNIVQYHVSGLDENYNDLSPIKLIIDEMRIKATNEGYKYFNLGGGRGSREDSLFAFKSSFSKDYKSFKLWKYIVDENIYKSLVEGQADEDLGDNIYNTDFFPAYRTKIKMLTK